MLLQSSDLHGHPGIETHWFTRSRFFRVRQLELLVHFPCFFGPESTIIGVSFIGYSSSSQTTQNKCNPFFTHCLVGFESSSCVSWKPSPSSINTFTSFHWSLQALFPILLPSHRFLRKYSRLPMSVLKCGIHILSVITQRKTTAQFDRPNYVNHM